MNRLNRLRFSVALVLILNATGDQSIRETPFAQAATPLELCALALRPLSQRLGGPTAAQKRAGFIHLALDRPDDGTLRVSRWISSQRRDPQYVHPRELVAPEAYARLRRAPEKARFRRALLTTLASEWASRSPQDAPRLVQAFRELESLLDEQGALVFSSLISGDAFESLVQDYDARMQSDGSVSLLHSYLNLANHSGFLLNDRFRHAFLHPLTIALVAYQVGGGVRLVDARAKNAGPIQARAQDNMLHIDNTPFNDEYKLILLWEQGKVAGPSGQNFVYLPGTQKGARQAERRRDGTVWSTENASIFVTRKSVNGLFAFQKAIGMPSAPSVVEVAGDAEPLAAVFSAGSLVHHRYRTEGGKPRSCVILAFQPIADNPGRLMDISLGGRGSPLVRSMMDGTLASDADFLAFLREEALAMGDKLDEISAGEKGTRVLNPVLQPLDPEERDRWITVATEAPEIEDIKLEKQRVPFGQWVPLREFLDVLAREMMFFDKHGPLDLILYADGHEEVRKWARNRIREMKVDVLEQRIKSWARALRSPKASDLLSPLTLRGLALEAARWIGGAVQAAPRNAGTADERPDALGPHEAISPDRAYRSLEQLIGDLGEAANRAYSVQNLTSTSLFLFLAINESMLLRPGDVPARIRESARRLLRHYIAMALVTHQQTLSDRRSKTAS